MASDDDSRIRLDGDTLVVDGPVVLAGTIRPPGDKSVSHRALLMAAIAKGESRISNLSTGADVSSTMRFLKCLGVGLQSREALVVVEGRGLEGLAEPTRVIDCQNSGTTMRLGSGLVAGLPYLSVLTGDASLRRRPMDRVAVPLSSMGAAVNTSPGGVPPVMIRGRRLRGIEYELPVASAQVKGAILLAGLAAEGRTLVKEKYPTREHTEVMLKALGASVEIADGEICLEPSEVLPFHAEIPGDISSASFFLAGAAMIPNSTVEAENVVLTPVRKRFADILVSMGAEIVCDCRGEVLGQSFGTLRAQWNGSLGGFSIGAREIPSLIDEVVILATAACLARGTSLIKDAAELRTKESDRIAALARELSKTGAFIEERPDGLLIKGVNGPPVAAEYDSHGDHRIAMATAMLACASKGVSRVHGISACAVSYPEFVSELIRMAGSDHFYS